MPAEKNENFIVFQEGQFGVKVKPNKKMHCGCILYTTFDRMFLIFFEETKDKPPVGMLNTSTSTNFLASMEYIELFVTKLALKLFLKNKKCCIYMEQCCTESIQCFKARDSL